MTWVRVKINDLSRLKLPAECPNCMQHLATTPTPLIRSVGVPFAIAISTHSSWLFCKRCSEWQARPAKWKKWFGIVPGLFLAGLAFYFAGNSLDNPDGLNPAAGWCLLASIVVAVGGCTIVHFLHLFSSPPEGCISNFPTVIPIRSGKQMLSRKTFAVFDFKNPYYVDALLAVNPDGNLDCSERALSKSRARFQASHSEWELMKGSDGHSVEENQSR